MENPDELSFTQVFIKELGSPVQAGQITYVHKGFVSEETEPLNLGRHTAFMFEGPDSLINALAHNYDYLTDGVTLSGFTNVDKTKIQEAHDDYYGIESVSTARTSAKK